MLSISSGHSASYLTDAVGSGMESYYTGAVTEGEPPGVWSGGGAEMLGLAGEVDESIMHEVYGRFADPRDPRFAAEYTRSEAGVLGRAPKQYRTVDDVLADRIRAYPGTPLPEQIQQWRTEAEASTPAAVMFHDLTYSPPKSVTVLHTAYERAAAQARAAGDTAGAEAWTGKVAEIDQAVAAANSTMLGYAAEYGGYARTGRHGAKGATGRWVDAHDWTVASFYQHTSRDLDPQLHVHNAILNRVPCPDGQWRAIDGRSLYAAKQGAGTVADRVLEVELTRRLGVSWTMRPDGVGREIDGVDAEVMDLFSSRSRTLTRRAEQLVAAAEQRFGRELTSLERDRLRRQASMATRRAKTHEGESRAEQLDRWDAELRTELAGGLGRIADRFADTAADRPAAGSWSEDLVIAQAVEACHTGTDAAGAGRSTFGRSELTRQILLALPDQLGDLTPAQVTDLADRLTDRALDSTGVVQTSGREYASTPTDSRLADGSAATVAPGSHRYAGAGHLDAEIALLRTAGVRGRHRLDRAELGNWLDQQAGPDAALRLSPAQREAVTGLATSDAAMAVLVGPAGTGKSVTAGTLAAAWADLSGGGRVVGVATAELAAQVLRDDGIATTANIAAFLTAQKRLAAGRLLPGDETLRLGPRDVLLVDEASMLDTAALTALQQHADTAGARVILTGDPRQLGAVGAGGLMRTAVDRGAETYTLSEVRRFENGWERDASLKLRDGDPSVVADYDRNGRIVDGGTPTDTVTAIARAAAADRIAGRSTLVVAPTNALAGQVAAAVREHLVEAGHVQATGTVLGRDGCTAGVGDLVQARRIDRDLGLTNRQNYQITAVRDDGGLDTVDTRTGQARTIPASYIAEDLTLAYAGTVHAAQGATVDTSHALITPGMSSSAAYVGLSRGREGNTGWVVTEPEPGDPNAAGPTDPDQPPGTGRGVLTDIITGRTDPSAAPENWSAVDIDTADTQALHSAERLTALIEDETRLACRQRLDTDLDQLVADNLLTEHLRARLGADQGSEYLARLLRAHEHAGTDPADLLRDAITSRDLTTARSVAQVIAGRIDATTPLPVPHLDDTGQPRPPARITADRAAHLTDLTDRLDTRRTELGTQLADEHQQPAADTARPEWLTVLGEIPDHPAARADWIRRAGTIAAWREATSWDSDTQPIGRCPGTSTPEKRALWHHAYTAAGMPEHRRPEAEMTDGRLLARVAAAERETNAAPPYVDDQLRHHHHTAHQATRDAILARSTGNHDHAEQLEQTAADAAYAAERLTQVADTRATWLAATLETREAGRAARDELTRRGINPDQPPVNAVTAEDWLTAEAAARTEDDHHRTITDTDIDTDTDLDLSERTSQPVHKHHQAADEHDGAQLVNEHHQADTVQDSSDQPSAAVLADTITIDTAVTAAQHAADQLADRASHDTAAAEDWLTEPADDHTTSASL